METQCLRSSSSSFLHPAAIEHRPTDVTREQALISKLFRSRSWEIEWRLASVIRAQYDKFITLNLLHPLARAEMPASPIPVDLKDYHTGVKKYSCMFTTFFLVLQLSILHQRGPSSVHYKLTILFFLSSFWYCNDLQAQHIIFILHWRIEYSICPIHHTSESKPLRTSTQWEIYLYKSISRRLQQLAAMYPTPLSVKFKQ